MKKYKLIKEYPGSPKLPFILDDTWKEQYGDPRYIINGLAFKPEDYPEYWEEIIEETYQILSFKSKGGSRIFTLRENGKYFLENDKRFNPKSYFCGGTLEFHLDNNDYIIHSVKRLSDGEIFTIGDKVEYQVNGKWDKESINVITGFNLSDTPSLLIYCIGSNPWAYLSDTVRKYVKKPLFTTEDGVDIYKGNVFYMTVIPFSNKNTINICRQIATDCYKTYNFKEKELIFSTKELAEEYVFWNKPCSMSLKDIFSIYSDKSSQAKQLIELELFKRKKQCLKL